MCMFHNSSRFAWFLFVLQFLQMTLLGLSDETNKIFLCLQRISFVFPNAVVILRMAYGSIRESGLDFNLDHT